MEQRKTRRFKLELPVSITRSGSDRVALTGCTKNISSAGVLFTTEHQADLNSPIEYIITLNREGHQSINLRCLGKVLRAGRIPSDSDHHHLAFQVAATLERYEFVRERSAAMG